MRPRNESARHTLSAALRSGPQTAQQIAAGAGVSLRTALRLVQELNPPALAVGAGSRRRYLMRRPLRNASAAMPLFRLDESGHVSETGALTLTYPAGSCCDLAALGWPLDAGAREGCWSGLPYPLYDMAPQGYLGRLFARQHHIDLEVAQDPRAWNDDDLVWILSRRGADLSGDLILGEAALKIHLQARSSPSPVLEEHMLPSAYPQHADEVLRLGPGMSSVAGEFPKFTAQRHRAGQATPHVLVKFSAPVDSSFAQRWSDLLVSEAIALDWAEGIEGVRVASTRILRHAGRTFLESERFDRVGDFGRRPLVSLHALNGHLLGLSSLDWRMQARALMRAGLIDVDVSRRIETLWWFGRLIANSDMHLGNLSFIPRDGRLALAPLYDMLPMAYAPTPGGELSPVSPGFELPLPGESAQWASACRAALSFWSACAADARISAPFQKIARDNAQQLARLAERG